MQLFSTLTVTRRRDFRLFDSGDDETTLAPIANRWKCIPFRFSNFNRMPRERTDSSDERTSLVLPLRYDFSLTLNIDEEIRVSSEQAITLIVKFRSGRWSLIRMGSVLCLWKLNCSWPGNLDFMPGSRVVRKYRGRLLKLYEVCDSHVIEIF